MAQVYKQNSIGRVTLPTSKKQMMKQLSHTVDSHIKLELKQFYLTHNDLSCLSGEQY